MAKTSPVTAPRAPRCPALGATRRPGRQSWQTPLSSRQQEARTVVPAAFGPHGAAASPSQAAPPAQPGSLEASASSLPGALPAGDGDPGWAPLNGRTAVVVGAGPAGCTLAMYLARAGWRVRVFEKRPEPGPATTSRQRSWVLTLYPRGIRPVTAVAEVPLLRERAYKGLVILPSKPGSKPVVLERCGVLIDRTLVATSVLESARQQYSSRVEFTFSAPLERVDFGRRTAVFGQPEETAAKAVREAALVGASAGSVGDAAASGTVKSATAAGVEVPYDLLVGADGSGSTVRSLLADAFPGQYDTKILSAPPSSSANALGCYKSVTDLPPLPEVERWDPDSGADPASRLPGQFFFVMMGGSKGFASVCRDIDGTYGGYIAASEQDFKRAQTQEDYLALLPQCGPQLPAQWLPLMAEKLAQVPVSSFPVMRSLSRFWSPGGVVLLGDAAHTVTPALGQGLNSALQDCELLGRELEGLGSDATPEALDSALQRFSDLRAPEVRALQELELLQGAGLQKLEWAPRDPLTLLMLLARKWIMFQYSGLALLGTVAATIQGARAGQHAGGASAPASQLERQQQQQQQQQREVGASVADMLASQMDATYVRSPPMYELLRGHTGYREMLTRVYGMAALGTGVTAALLYGGGAAVAGLLGRLVAGV